MSNLYISDLFESVVMMDVRICDGSTKFYYFKDEAKQLLQLHMTEGIDEGFFNSISFIIFR